MSLLDHGLQKKDANYARCSLCSCDLKYSAQGFTQHSVVKQHKDVSKIRFGVNKTQKIFSSTFLSKALPQRSLTLDAPLQSKVSTAEAMWAFKVAEKDFTLQDCHHIPLLFKNMFPDSSICQSFSMFKSKVSYIFQDGLGPLLLKWTCQSVHHSSSGFTIIFDETTTEEKIKQVDILVRYWDEEKHLVVTKYLRSLTFCCATAVDITKMFTDLQDKNIYDLLWARLFNISADRPKINKATWGTLNELQARNTKV